MAVFRVARCFSKDREDYLDLEKVSNLSDDGLNKIIKEENSTPSEIAATLRESRARLKKKTLKKEGKEKENKDKEIIPLTQGNFKTSKSTKFLNSYEIKQDSILKKNNKGEIVFDKRKLNNKT